MGRWLQAAELYRAMGWRGTLCLSGKSLVDRGYTGYDGGWPSDEDVQKWGDNRSGYNLAIRVPKYVVGVDVDGYDGKRGGHTLALLELEHGPLPSTWITTSRMDGVSGIRLYRVDPEKQLITEPGPGIELVQFHHRYATVWPSVHPKTEQPYQWLDDEFRLSNRPPYPHELPELPEEWVQALHTRRPPGRRTVAPSSPGVNPGGAPPQSPERQILWWKGWVRSHAPDKGLNNSLNKAAYELRPLVLDGKLDDSEVIEALLDVSNEIAGPEYESKARATIRSGLGILS